MRFSSTALAAQVALALTTAVSAISVLDRRATVCNGHAELCSRSYGNVSFVGAHDSYAVSSDNNAANQDYPVTQQLNDGIRMLQVQALQSNTGIELCHTNCVLFDGGSLQSYLTNVTNWVKSNPAEVVTILIVNVNDLPVSQFASVYQQVGLDTLSYSPPSSALPATGWPTLGNIIDSGKRVVTFMDHQADFNSVPYIIDEFSNIWETPFDETDPSFPCSVNRTTGDSTTQMYVMNHFLDTAVQVLGQVSFEPAKDNLTTTNAASGFGSLGEQADSCAAQHGKFPNFLLVDFYDWGNGSVFEVAARLNDVTYTPNRTIGPPAPGSTVEPHANGALGPRPSPLASFAPALIISVVCVCTGLLSLL